MLLKLLSIVTITTISIAKNDISIYSLTLTISCANYTKIVPHQRKYDKKALSWDYSNYML